MKEPRSYVLTTGIAAVALAYAVRLSAPGRGVVDWIVMGVVLAAILWSLWGLGRRLYRAGGGKAVGHLLRTLTFWLVGLMNTAWAVGPGPNLEMVGRRGAAGAGRPGLDVALSQRAAFAGVRAGTGCPRCGGILTSLTPCRGRRSFLAWTFPGGST